MKRIKPLLINFQDTRLARQKLNNDQSLMSLLSGQIDRKWINEKEFGRVRTELFDSGLIQNEKDIFEKCRSDKMFATVLAGRISKCATKQGNLDEKLQLEVAQTIAKQCHSMLKINQLNNKAFRPTKDGRILSKKEMEKTNFPKSECLKSFDGEIRFRKKNVGYLFSKIVFGVGGHQDNVFEELDVFCDWVSKTQDSYSEKVFIAIIDTDLLKNLQTIQDKYQDVSNLMIFDHVKFQEYLIQTYYPNK